MLILEEIEVLREKKLTVGEVKKNWTGEDKRSNCLNFDEELVRIPQMRGINLIVRMGKKLSSFNTKTFKI